MAAQADIVKMTCKVPTELHKKVMDEVLREESTLSKVIVKIIQEYYNNGGKKGMESKVRTLAVQVDEELYQRIKAHLDRHIGADGKRLTQKEFLINLILKALELDEVEEQEEPTGSEFPSVVE